MDYTTLVASRTTAGSIANWINHTDAQAAAPTILDEAQSQIYRRLRHWRMLAEQTGQAMTAGNDYINLPADYLEDKVLQILGPVNSMVYQTILVRKTMEEVKANYCLDGNGARVQQQPQIYYTFGNAGTPRLKFDSPPDLAYPYEFTYYAQPAALSSGNATNFLTSLYPRMVRCACMVGASEFMKDAGVGNYDRTYWVQEMEKEIGLAQVESDSQHRSIQTGAVIV